MTRPPADSPGHGANNPQPLSKRAAIHSRLRRAQPLDQDRQATSRRIREIAASASEKCDWRVIHVSSSDELLSLLDRAAPGPGGKITVRNSKPTNHSKDANRIGATNRLDAASRRNADRRPVDMRTASSSLPRGLMQ